MIKRLLVVGLGSIGRRHARVARTVLPGLEIVALRHRVSGAPSCEEVDRSVSSIAEAIACKPQAAIVANPASYHVEVALPLANAGVHLLVEKPISDHAEGVSGLIDICAQKSVTLMIGYNMRFLSSLRRFRELIADRPVGRVLSVRAEVGQYLPSWRPGSDYRSSVSARSALGGGVLLELSHEIDYLRWLFGDVEWVSARLFRQSSLEIDVEDTAYLTLGFACGADPQAITGSLNLDFVRHDSTRSCTVICEEGTLRWDAVAARVESFERGATEWRVHSSEVAHRDDSYGAEWEHFLACIESGAPPTVSGADGLATLRVVEAAKEVSMTGAVVSIGRAEGGAGARGGVE
ncbi:MAG: Gfo/Idh/MocA family oxidoreductase [Bacillota bacterium]|nr:Gfo/Idh/MocA family oxidoreductase [Bacillota bacterium]